MLIVFTGNGKGKTTAAIGQAIRALGSGKRVFVIEFIKCKKSPSGEDGVLSAFEPRLHFEKCGLGFVGILGDKLPFAKHRAAAHRALAKAQGAMLSGNYDLLVLDEVNVALDLKLVDLEEVVAFLEAVPANVDLLFTGRHAHSEILARADLITNYEDVWHPFRTQAQVPARRGIEY
jgi:cob(I)alamin adenosyltransferase